MRLIDKDRLLKGSNHYWLEMENFGDIEAIDVRFIEMAEEIKAIPIEWIEEWLDKTTGTRDGDDISQLPEQLKFAIEMINLMEMDWVKENDKSV